MMTQLPKLPMSDPKNRLVGIVLGEDRLDDCFREPGSSVPLRTLLIREWNIKFTYV